MKHRVWRRCIYPQLEHRLVCKCDRDGHDMYRVARWGGRVAQHREKFRCRHCHMEAWIEYEPPAGYAQVHGPAVSIRCTKQEKQIGREAS